MDFKARIHRLDSAKVCLVTGASGFLGQQIVQTLLLQGLQVRALINRTPLAIEHPALEIVQGDINAEAVLDAACKGVDVVFHAAALIALMGGRHASRDYRDKAWATNVDGTRSVIAACRRNGVSRLIYTSSVDVTFDGEPAPAMDESLPYAQDPKSVYAVTKIAAEKLILAANNDALKTCALRPDGIWGDPPCDMLDRFVEQLSKGRLKVRMGAANTLQDNSHVANLVHAHLLAADCLANKPNCGGKAWFISDGEPMNSFDFFLPLFGAFKQAVPRREIGRGILMPVLRVWQGMHFSMGLPAPVLTPHELDKISITHYGSNDLAAGDLGYQPVVDVAEGMASVVETYRESGLI